MTRRGITRRRWIAGVSGMSVAEALATDAPGAEPADADTPAPDATEALRRLVEGNRRFVAGQTQHAHRASEWRRHLVQGQHPSATILGCSDSRIPPELVFDQGFGDLFVIRVAGNMIEPAVFGSIGYAVAHLKTPLLVVLGHDMCGAVTAACDELFRKAKEPPEIEALLEFIKPGLTRIDPNLSRARQIELGVETNVRFAMSQLAELLRGKLALKSKRIEVVGGVYELESGKVRFLD